MYSADGIGRTGHRLLALTFVAIAAVGLGLILAVTGPLSIFLLVGLIAWGFATIALGMTAWVSHAPYAMKVRTTAPANDSTNSTEPANHNSNETMFDYEALDDTGHPLDMNPGRIPATNFQGSVPRGAVVDERPPPPPIPEVVRSRHDFAAKYTQDTPQIREILTHTSSKRPQRIRAKHADPTVHTSKLPPATMRGKCGECNTLLLAPTHRPVEMECPECQRVTLLE
jgi:hypothetical protein